MHKIAVCFNNVTKCTKTAYVNNNIAYSINYDHALTLLLYCSCFYCHSYV